MLRGAAVEHGETALGKHETTYHTPHAQDEAKPNGGVYSHSSTYLGEHESRDRSICGARLVFLSRRVSVTPIVYSGT